MVKYGQDLCDHLKNIPLLYRTCEVRLKPNQSLQTVCKVILEQSR